MSITPTRGTPGSAHLAEVDADDAVRVRLGQPALSGAVTQDRNAGRLLLVFADMTTGVALNATDANNQIDASVRLAHEAAAAGLRSAWFGQTFGADSPQLAAVVGREVPGLHVGTSAIPVFGRHPLLVSSQAQTAQAATHGRYHLGLALGTKLLTEAGFGIPYERPIARLREFLTALRQLTETGTADFHGELLTATTPIPARVPGAESGVPLLVAAMGPQALRASGELADGILPYLAGPRALSEHIVPAVTAAAEAAGRPRPGSSPWCTAWSPTTSTPYGRKPPSSSRSTSSSRPTHESSDSPAASGPSMWL